MGRECSRSYISGRGCSWSHISGRGLKLVVGCGWSCDGKFENEVLGAPLEVPGPVVDDRINVCDSSELWQIGSTSDTIQFKGRVCSELK